MSPCFTSGMVVAHGANKSFCREAVHGQGVKYHAVGHVPREAVLGEFALADGVPGGLMPANALDARREATIAARPRLGTVAQRLSQAIMVYWEGHSEVAG
jgi:hypothetical protein